MTMRLSTATRNRLCDSAVDHIETGAGTSKLQLWSGSRPTLVTDAPAGDLLAEFSLPDPCFGSASSGTATANAITGTTGITDGSVGFARVVNQNNDAIWDNNDVGVGTGQIQLTTLSIFTGIAVDVTAWTVTMPAE